MDQTFFSLRTITDLSIFGEYKTDEDRLTAALLQVLHYGGHPLIAKLFGDIFDLPSNEVNVIPQSVQENSRPDGEITCDCHYQIFIESKIVPNDIRNEQLENHCRLANPSNGQYLIYLTPDKTKPKKLEMLSGLVEWMSWEQISDILQSLLKETSNELIIFLIRQLILLIAHTLEKAITKNKKRATAKEANTTNEKLQTKPVNNTVIIVGGHWGENVAKKYNFYACQPNRFFCDARYIAFYHQNRIKELFKIVDKPIESIDIQTCSQVPSSYFTDTEPGYKPQKRKLFLLEHIHTFDPTIQNDKTDKKGHSCAFVQRQTYTTYDKIMNAKFTSEL